jgi:aminomethyltransferase
MTTADNPYELGMDRLVVCDGSFDFIGKKSLQKIKKEGIKRNFVGLEISGRPLIGSNDERWSVFKNREKVGYITSAIYSPRLEKNIALAMVSSGAAVLGTSLEVDDGKKIRKSSVVPKPFYDPNKTIATST